MSSMLASIESVHDSYQYHGDLLEQIHYALCTKFEFKSIKLNVIDWHSATMMACIGQEVNFV